ncbi:hypothetical protein ABEB36_009352 [Hypothenemus hampei]|uniref:Uncharacterized protein n=1 Tax=Hypothenemus hampei TaxID=57062 RepID=A0ABD1EG33_HYPHA
MLKKIIGYDASSLPPTKQELLQQIKRTLYICNVWCNAHLASPTEKTLENYGWTIIDGKYEYYWFDGPQSPTFDELSSDFQAAHDDNNGNDSCQEDNVSSEEESSDEMDED